MKTKQFGIAVFSALILLTVASTPLSGQQGNGSYDPWLDYDENGIIDTYELQQLGGAYGSTGDTTKNVTIAGHITAYLRPGGANFSLPGGTNWYSDRISIDGYATVTVLIQVSSASNFEGRVYACDNSGCSWVIESFLPVNNNWVKTYDVMNQRIQIFIRNGGPPAITANVGVYLVA